MSSGSAAATTTCGVMKNIGGLAGGIFMPARIFTCVKKHRQYQSVSVVYNWNNDNSGAATLLSSAVCSVGGLWRTRAQVHMKALEWTSA